MTSQKLGGEKKTSQTQFEQACETDRLLTAYKAWVLAEGHITYSASSVLSAWAEAVNLDPKIKARLAVALGFNR